MVGQQASETLGRKRDPIGGCSDVNVLDKSHTRILAEGQNDK